MPYSDPDAKRASDRAYYVAHADRQRKLGRARAALIRDGQYVVMSGDLRVQFERYVDRSPAGCWEWTGSRTVKGYGRLNVAGRVQGAHRVGYKLYVGPIPDGMTLDHLCRNPPCVNPAHLEIVTAAENFHRAMGVSTQQPCGRGHDPSRKVFHSDGGMAYCRDCRNEQRRRRYREDPSYREHTLSLDRRRTPRPGTQRAGVSAPGL